MDRSGMGADKNGGSNMSGNLMGGEDRMDWGGMMAGGVMNSKSGDVMDENVMWGDVMS